MFSSLNEVWIIEYHVTQLRNSRTSERLRYATCDVILYRRDFASLSSVDIFTLSFFL